LDQEKIMKKLSRREFLRLTAASLGSVTLGRFLAACSPVAIQSPSAPTTTPPPLPIITQAASTEAPTATLASTTTAPGMHIDLGQSTVAVIQSSKAQAQDIQYDEIKAMVKKAVDLAGGFGDMLKDGQTVVIKPNLMGKSVPTNAGDQMIPKEGSGVVTDWRVTKAIVELVRQTNPSGKVYVMEGSALQDTAGNMAYLNYTPEMIPGVDQFLAIETDSGGWQDFTSPGLVKIDPSHKMRQVSYYHNKKIAEADVLISVPVLKNHYYSAITGGIKNIAVGSSPANIYGNKSGEINRFNRIPHDMNLHKWIHDFWLAKPANLVIMDGLQGAQHGSLCYTDQGELEPNQKNMRMIIAGRDAVAVDTIQALLMGWDPESVKYLEYLNKSGAGNLNTAYITVAGSPVDTVRKDFAGQIPFLGGMTVSDTQAPSLSINQASVAKGELHLALAVEDKTSKAEVYIDDQLQQLVLTADFGKASLDVSRVAKGAHTVKVWAYDRFLNRTEQVQSLDF
jgi:uncharacterized protein (DUF362 family)